MKSKNILPYKRNLNDNFIILIILLLFILVFSYYSYIFANQEIKKIDQSLDSNPKYAVVDISKIIYSFTDLYSQLNQIKNEIKTTYYELYNLDKNLELNFIKEMEIYSNSILYKQKELEKKLTENLLKNQNLDQKVKLKILKLKEKIENQIIKKRNQTQNIIYQY
ncbi:MAG: hypothetical protein ACP5O4_06255, partial [bacterium]